MNIRLHFKQNRRMNYKLFSLLFICVLSEGGFAQIRYCYDADGNRKQSLSIGTARAIRPNSNDTTPDIKAMQTAMQNGISVYPNPSTSTINVTINSFDSSKTAAVYLMDIAGNIEYSKQVTSVPVPINISGFAEGVYFVKVVIGKKELFYRVVKSNR